MRRFEFEVIVHLKEGLADPQGKAVDDALRTMGWTNVSDVRVGKSVTLAVEAASAAEAEEQVEEISRRVLTNPVIERFEIEQREGASR